jgi:polysaccharide biosynthesis protein PslF
MMTFSPTIAKTICSSTPFITQFESVGVAVAKTSAWTRLIRKGIARWVTGPGTDYNNGTLLRDSDGVIALSDHHTMKLEELFSHIHQKCVLIPPPPTITVCPNHRGEARVRGRTALELRDEEFLLVYYGYVYPGKGIETLLHAFQTVLRRKPKVRLALVGGVLEHMGGEFSGRSKSYADEIQRLPRVLGIADQVKFTGVCPPENEQGSLYLRAADLCVLPFDDGVYLNKSSFAAAAAHGLPIVTTRGPILENPFLHEENVFLCPPKDPDALANAIQMLIDSPDLRKRLETGVRSLTEEWFSWERATDRVIEMFGAKA